MRATPPSEPTGRSPGRSRLGRHLLLGLLSACAACGVEIQPSTIEVSARLIGGNPGGGEAPPVVLSLQRGPEPSPRLAQAAAAGIEDLTRVELAVTESTGLTADEEFFVVSLSNPAPIPGAFPPAPELTDAPGWIRAHTGDLVVLPLRKDDITLPQNAFDAFEPSPRRSAGAAWLARVEDDDPVLPWMIEADDAACDSVSLETSLVAPPQGQPVDCFDVQTLTSMFLAQFALRLTKALAEEDTGGAALSASGHRLHVIPHVTSGVGDPGFGMVYAADVDVAKFGLPAARAGIQVPLSLHVRYDGGLYVDPLSEMTSPANPARVTVTAHGPLADTVAPAIRAAVLEALAGAELPGISGSITQPDGTQLPVDVSAEETLEFAINGSSGRSPTASEDFSMVALPVQRATVTGTLSTLVLSLPFLTRDVVAPDPGATAGTTADGGGVVSIVEVTQPPVVSTTYAIPPPVAHVPFRLLFLQ